MPPRVKQWLNIERTRFKRFIAAIAKYAKRYTHSPLCLQLRRFKRGEWAQGIAGEDRASMLLFRTTLVVSVEKLRWYLFAWIGSKSELSVRIPIARKITIEIGVGEATEITETTMLEKFYAVQIFRLARKKSRKEIRAVEARFINDCN